MMSVDMGYKVDTRRKISPVTPTVTLNSFRGSITQHSLLLSTSPQRLYNIGKSQVCVRICVSTAALLVEQVMLEALSSKRAFATEPHRGALQDMEEYYGVKGLLNNSATIIYKRHNNRVHEAMQAAAAARSAGSHACLHCLYTLLFI